MVDTILERVKSMPILTWLKVLVALAPFVTYGVQELRLTWANRDLKLAQAEAVVAIDTAVRAARAEEKSVQSQLCDARFKQFEATFQGNAFTTVTVVQEAAKKVERAPTDKEALQKLCDGDPMCRDRRKN